MADQIQVIKVIRLVKILQLCLQLVRPMVLAIIRAINTATASATSITLSNLATLAQSRITSMETPRIVTRTEPLIAQGLLQSQLSRSSLDSLLIDTPMTMLEGRSLLGQQKILAILQQLLLEGAIKL